MMLKQILNQCWSVVALFFFTAAPLWAADGEQEPEWVLSYAIILAFLTLTLLILLRPTKRSDSAFSYDEQKAIKEEEMKKLKNLH